MQSSLSSGMVSPKGTNPLAPQGEWTESRLGGNPENIPAESALGKAMAIVEAREVAKRARRVSHSVVVLTGSNDQFLLACSCGYDTGMEPVRRAREDMVVHQACNQVRSHCDRSAIAVGVAR